MTDEGKTLANQIDMASWDLLRAHLERGGLIVVAMDMDLVQVGERMVADDSDTIMAWLADGRLAKPSASQIETWDTSKSLQFRMLIVSPYVLMQETPSHVN